MFLETCSYYREPSKAKVLFPGFWELPHHLLQLPHHNVIHHHVSVLVSDVMCIAWLQA